MSYNIIQVDLISLFPFPKEADLLFPNPANKYPTSANWLFIVWNFSSTTKQTPQQIQKRHPIILFFLWVGPVFWWS